MRGVGSGGMRRRWAGTMSLGVVITPLSRVFDPDIPCRRVDFEHDVFHGGYQQLLACGRAYDIDVVAAGGQQVLYGAERAPIGRQARANRITETRSSCRGAGGQASREGQLQQVAAQRVGRASGSLISGKLDQGMVHLPGPGPRPRGVCGVGEGEQALVSAAQQSAPSSRDTRAADRAAGHGGRAAGDGRRGEKHASKGEEALREVAQHGNAQLTTHAMRRD